MISHEEIFKRVTFIPLLIIVVPFTSVTQYKC